MSAADGNVDAAAKNVGDVMGNVLNDTQKAVGFPLNPQRDRPSSGTTETTITYNFYTVVNVKLETNWEVIPGLILEEATLSISVDGYGGSGSAEQNFGFGIRISAKCTIADIEFNVTGEIPDVRKNTETTFILTITAKTKRSLISPQALIQNLTGTKGESGSSGRGFDFDNTVKSSAVPDNISEQLTQDGKNGGGFAATAQIAIRRTVEGTYYLQKLSFGVYGSFEWSPVSGLQISKAGISVTVSKDDSKSEWDWEIIAAGALKIGDCPVVAKARFTKSQKTTSEFMITIEARPFLGVSAKGLMGALVATQGQNPGDEFTSQLTTSLSPDLTAQTSALDGVAAKIVADILVSKSAGAEATWKMKYARIYAGFPGLNWSPIDDIELRALHLVISADRIDIASGQGSEWSYSGWAKASILLCKSILVDATIMHAPEPQLSPSDVANKITQITIELPSKINIPLDRLANDQALVGPVKTNLQKVASDSPGPSSSPVKLDSVSDFPKAGSNRGLVVFLKDKKVKRVTFRANTTEVWKLTEQLQVTRLGIYFDIVNPREVEIRRIAGYIYGEVQIGRSVKLFAFAAGKKAATSGEYWVGFSARYDPDAPLAVEAGSVVASPELGSLDVPAEGWSLPAFPTKVSTALSSLDVKLLAQFLTTPDETDPKKSNTTLEKVQVRATAEGTWKLWDGFSIGDAGLDVTAERLKKPVLADGKEQKYAIYVDLHGSLTVQEKYYIYFFARFAHGPTELPTFIIDITAQSLGSDGATKKPASGAVIAGLDTFGTNSVSEKDNVIEGRKIDDNIPDGFPVSAKQFSSDDTEKSNLHASVMLSKGTEGSWKLSYLSLELRQSDPWNLTEKLQIFSSAAELRILNPVDSDKSKRKYAFYLRTRIRLGQVDLARVTVSVVHVGENQGLALFTIETGPILDILKELLAPEDRKDFVPEGSPFALDKTESGFSMYVYAGKNSESKWEIRHAMLELQAITGRESWQICDGFKVTKLNLRASFQNIHDKDKKRTITITGEVQFGQTPVEVILEISDTLITVRVNVVKASATEILGTLVSGGLDNNELEAPPLPADAGLANYKTSGATAVIIFTKETGGSYKAKSAAIRVSTPPNFLWTLIDGTLVMDEVYAELRVDNLSAPRRDFKALVYGHLYDPSGGSRLKNPPGLGVTLAATKEELLITITASVEGCSFVDVIYIVTGGVWKLSALDLFPKFVELLVRLRWSGSQKGAAFTGVLADWDLGNIAPSLLSVQRPRLTLSVQKSASKTAPTGIIEGECVVLGAKIPVSYELPSGPLRVFGIDVKIIKKIKELVQRLKKLFDDAMKIGEIIADLAGTAAEVAAALESALLAVGFAAAVVAGVIAAFFSGGGGGGGGSGGSGGGGSSGSSEGSNKDPKKDDSGSESKWVVGGPGLSNGPAGQLVTLFIYPRNAKSQVLNIDIRRLTVSISQAGLAAPIVIRESDFELLEKGDGYRASYTRPPALGEYSIKIDYDLAPSVALEYKVQVTAGESVVNKDSFLRVPARVPVGVLTSALIFPIDNFGKPRLGYNDSASFVINFTPKLPPQSYNLIVYNDCLSINFTLPPEAARTEYTLDVKFRDKNDSSTDIVGAPAKLSAVIGVDPEKTEAFGEGLSSGVGLEKTDFVVRLKDQLGGALSAEELTTLKYSVHLRVDRVEGEPPKEEVSYPLTPTTINSPLSQLEFSYTRPEIGRTYTIYININESSIPHSPFYIESLATKPILSVPHSMLILSTAKVFAGSKFRIQIEAYDNKNNRRVFGGEKDSFLCQFLKAKEVFPVTMDPVVDNGDGTYFWDVVAPDELMNRDDIEISVTNATDPTQTAFGSPGKIRILQRPELRSIRCFGPGLGSGPAEEITTFYVELLDQYEERIKPNSSIAFKERCKITLLQEQISLTSIPQADYYSVSYSRPKTDDDYNIIRISLDGAEYSESPFYVYNTPAPDATSGTSAAPITEPSNCRMEWPVPEKVEGSDKPVGKAIVFAVDQFNHRRFVGGDRLKVFCDSTELLVQDNLDGTYTIPYVPWANEASFSVRIGGTQLPGSPWKIPAEWSAAKVTLSGAGIARAEIGNKAYFMVKYKPSGIADGSGYAVLYPKENSPVIAADSIILIPFPSPFSATESPRLSYILPYDTPGVNTGTYVLKVFWNFTAAKFTRVMQVTRDVAVTAQPIFDVTGLDLDWYGPVSLPGTYPNSFEIISDPPITNLTFDDIAVNAVYAEYRMPFRRLINASAFEFKLSIPNPGSGKVRVDWGMKYGGLESFLTFTYRKKTQILPLSGDDAWRLVVDDSANSLTIWRLGYPQSVDPAKGCSIYRGTGLRLVDDDGTRLQDEDDKRGEPGRMVFIKKPKWNGKNQWAGAKWPMLTPVRLGRDYDAFMFHYRIKWTSWEATEEIKLHAPVDLQAKEGKVALLRYKPTRGAVWTIYDGHKPPSKRYDYREKSAVLDAEWKDILFVYTATELVVYENGRKVLQEGRDNIDISAVNVRMHSLSPSGFVVVEVKAVKTCPMSFHYLDRVGHHSMSSWNEVVLNTENSLSAAGSTGPFIAMDTEKAGSLETKFERDALKISSDGSNGQDDSILVSALYPQYGVDWESPLQLRELNPYSIIQYRLQIPRAESNFQVLLLSGAITLAIDMHTAIWTLSNGKKCESEYIVEAGPFIDVTCIMSPGHVVIWENGQMVMDEDADPFTGHIMPDVKVVHPTGGAGGRIEVKVARIRVVVGADVNDQVEPKWWEQE